MAEKPFYLWVKRLQDSRFGGRFQRVADEAGITFSALSRSAKAGSTSIKTLLKLCIATGISPEEVFTVAGKREIHDLITQLYGPSAEFSVSARARAVAILFDQIEDESQKQFFEKSLTGLADGVPTLARTDAPSDAKKGRASGRAGRRGNP